MPDIKFSELTEETKLTENDETLLSNKRRTTLSTLKDWLQTAFSGVFMKLTGNQTIVGETTLKGKVTVKDVAINHDVRLLEGINKRRTVQNIYTRNQGDLGGVRWSRYTDADSSVVGTRKIALRGYPLKPTSGGIGSNNIIMSFEFDTYDGESTATRLGKIFETIFFRPSKIGIGTKDPDAPFHNYSNNATTNSPAFLAEQDGTGDTTFHWLLTGVRRWIAGIDHSDGGSWKLATGGSSLGEGVEAIRVSTAGEMTLKSLVLSDLPTSSTGLAVGKLWRDGTDIKIVI